MENEKYIKIKSYSIASFISEGRVCPVGAAGLFRSTICIRNKGTKIIEGFYGSVFFFEEDSAEERMWRLQTAIDLMMKTLKKSDTFKFGNYEVRNHFTGEWEQIKI